MTKIIEGTLPEMDLRRAFVNGARWWELQQTGATMWQTDRNLAEAEAEKLYPGGKDTELEALRAELTATREALEAARGLIAYRDRNTLNFQLEKADDFLLPIHAALSRLDAKTL